jgi:hypothetical protein
VQRGELKDAVVEQQIKISKLERQGFNCFLDIPTTAMPTGIAGTREVDHTED